MSSYDMSPKAYMKMIEYLDVLESGKLGNFVEFKGTQTIATYLRQAMVSAEYNNDEKYARLNKMWSISYRRDSTIVCKRKTENGFRTFKFLTGVTESVTALAQNLDALALYFPNVKPSEVSKQLLPMLMEKYPDFQVNRFTNTEGLLIGRRIEK